jgi:hypothetical protein
MSSTDVADVKDEIGAGKAANEWKGFAQGSGFSYSSCFILPFAFAITTALAIIAA